MNGAWRIKSSSKNDSRIVGKEYGDIGRAWVTLVTVRSLILCAVEIWASPWSEIEPCGLIFCLCKSDTEKFSLHSAAHVIISFVWRLMASPLHKWEHRKIKWPSHPAKVTKLAKNAGFELMLIQWLNPCTSKGFQDWHRWFWECRDAPDPGLLHFLLFYGLQCGAEQSRAEGFISTHLGFQPCIRALPEVNPSLHHQHPQQRWEHTADSTGCLWAGWVRWCEN